MTSFHYQRRAGFTLLEILLTMIMAVVLMALINEAFKFYARDMNVSNEDIRQTQVVAAIMQMIENDLRSALHTDEVDMAPFEEKITAFASGGGDTGGTDNAATSSAVSGPSATDTTTTESLGDEVTSGLVLASPGLIGNQYQVQIDISQLPRLEEYVAILDANNANLNDVPSDIKTVTYFVQEQETVGGIEDPLEALNPNSMSDGTGGLIRRSLDRIATVYAAEQGNLAQLNSTGELIAPEVLGIEFQYFDGNIWQIEWNSDEYEEMPLAVRVDLSLKSPLAEAAGLDENDENAIRVFTHIIRLQNAEPIEEEEDTSDVTGAT